MAVWCVGSLPGVGIMITGSADRTLRIWKTGRISSYTLSFSVCY